jgi:hypothetical protein
MNNINANNIGEIIVDHHAYPDDCILLQFKLKYPDGTIKYIPIDTDSAGIKKLIADLQRSINTSPDNHRKFATVYEFEVGKQIVDLISGYEEYNKDNTLKYHLSMNSAAFDVKINPWGTIHYSLQEENDTPKQHLRIKEEISRYVKDIKFSNGLFAEKPYMSRLIYTMEINPIYKNLVCLGKIPSYLKSCESLKDYIHEPVTISYSNCTISYALEINTDHQSVHDTIKNEISAFIDSCINEKTVESY